MKRRRTSSKFRARKRRTSYRRPRTFKRYKRRWGRRSFRRTGLRGTGPVKLTVKRTVYAGQVNGFSTTGVGNFWRYQTWSLNKAFTNFDATGTSLGNMPDLDKYEGLYEQFRINAIRFKFVPRYNNFNTPQLVPSAGVTQTTRPYVAIVKDGKTTITPSGVYGSGLLNTLMEHGAKIYRADRPFTVYMKGLVQDTVASGSVIKYIKPPVATLDTAGKDLQHRGFHMYAYSQGFDNVFNHSFDLYVTYYVTFSNPK